MKKKLTYRDKLIELAYIYSVKEIQDYIRRRKNLTTGQIELILKKNKVVIPKDFNTSFIKENITKPISKLKSSIAEYKEEKIKDKNKFFRKVENYKYDTSRKVNYGLSTAWKNIGNIGLNFLNIIPQLGKTIFNFFGNLFTDVFNAIYNQEIDPKKAKNVIISFFALVGVTIAVIASVNYYKNFDSLQTETKIKKPEIKVKKETKKPEIKVKRKSVTEVILPDLNLKTETVIQLFKDVDYDLKKVRNEKLVKPIYFTQFPRDLDNLSSVQLKKETFIKIVLPLIVAENEKILADRIKLQNIITKKFTSDLEKQWLRQKLLEYKVKKSDFKELELRMDMIPVSIALAQAAKESGWGTSRFALEGNAIFGQWTWNGQGIAPLDRDDNKNHKILKFPILRASVKAYKNNLNTHKSYLKFRQKRKKLRENNIIIKGLALTDTLKNYAQTGSEYTKILNQIITQNRLSDFEPVKLVNSVKQVELNS
mgnify:CR=1 FL=1